MTTQYGKKITRLKMHLFNESIYCLMVRRQLSSSFLLLGG